MDIQAVATSQGLQILKENFRDIVKQFVLIGDTTDGNTELDNDIVNSNVVYDKIEKYIIFKNDIRNAHFDGNGLLTFELVLPYDINLLKFIYGVALISTDKNLVSIAATPKIYKVSGIGGSFIYKVSVGGKPGEIVYNNSDTEFATAEETLDGIAKCKAIDPHLLRQSFDNFKETFPTSGFKNLIINGDFRIWQRGDIFENTAGYIADRWIISNYREQFSYVEHSYDFFNDMDCIKVTAVGDKPDLGHDDLIYTLTASDILPYRGRTLTLSFWAKAEGYLENRGVYSDIIGLEYTVKPQGKLMTYNDSWQKYTLSFTVPNFKKSDIKPRSVFRIWFNMPPKGTFWLANVQLEEGEIATPFEERPLPVEEILCKRYFERITGVIGSGFIHSDGMGGAATVIFQKKRVIPSINVVGDTLFNNGLTVEKANSYEFQYQKLNCVLLKARFAGKLHNSSGVVAIQNTGYIDINAEI